MNLTSWLIALVGPLVVRGLISLGFTAFVFTGVTVVSDSLIATAKSNWSSMPATVIQLASLSGIPESLGMIFGAVLSVYTAKAALGFGRYVFKK